MEKCIMDRRREGRPEAVHNVPTLGAIAVIHSPQAWSCFALERSFRLVRTDQVEETIQCSLRP
jgi:hypothetical protein